MGLNEICESIKKYNNFLITAHIRPEADALGSVLGFYNLIKKLGKQAVMIIDDQLPQSYDFLPGTESIRRFGNKSSQIKFDCLVVLDCADLKRTGRVERLIQQNQPVINIDHHISNKTFGSRNWVDARASSCSEMIYQLYKRLRLKMDKDTALVLYAGIMTDTGSFRYSNTSSATFCAAAELLKFKVDVAWVYRQAYENIERAQVKTLLKILSEIKFFGQGRIITFGINLKLPKAKISADLADHILTFGRSIKGVQVVVLFKRNPGAANQFRVNLRSQGEVDVNKVAAFFKGGGHRAAAGCTIDGGFFLVRRKVVAKICRELKKKR